MSYDIKIKKLNINKKKPLSFGELVVLTNSYRNVRFLQDNSILMYVQCQDRIIPKVLLNSGSVCFGYCFQKITVSFFIAQSLCKIAEACQKPECLGVCSRCKKVHGVSNSIRSSYLPLSWNLFKSKTNNKKRIWGGSLSWIYEWAWNRRSKGYLMYKYFSRVPGALIDKNSWY